MYFLCSAGKILVTVFDNGIPPASSSAASYVDIVTINDNQPRFAIHNETECITETTNNRGNRRRRRDVKGEEAETDEREPFVQKRKVCFAKCHALAVFS